MILNKMIPKASGKHCMESKGWLITVGKDKGEISLIHPFSGVQIELPHPNTLEDYVYYRTVDLCMFFRKAVLSASPSHTSDYVLMVIVGSRSKLSFWRPGDLRWNKISWDEPIVDVTYFNGHFYCVDQSAIVLVYDVADPQLTKNLTTLLLLYAIPCGSRSYILESLGSLFVVVRNGFLWDFKNDGNRLPVTHIRCVKDKYIYGTQSFRVFQIDLPEGKVTDASDLGDRAFFIGHSASISVQASQFPGIKSNHIYFTDDYWQNYIFLEEGGGLDMGVFNLADDTIQPHYEGLSQSHVCPPIWVTPTLY